MTIIEESIRELAADRDSLSQLKASIKAQEEELAQTMEYKRLEYMQEQVKEIAAAVSEKEETIKKQALALYDGENKQVHPAVQIKSFTVVDYDEFKMKEWAIEHDIPAMLNLNKSAANQVAKGPTAPDFVTISTEDRAQIKSDLSDYLLTV